MGERERFCMGERSPSEATGGISSAGHRFARGAWSPFCRALRLHSKKSGIIRPRRDPARASGGMWNLAMPATLALDERVAFVFPGQGSQYVGMGKALYEASAAARQVFQQADSVLGFGLTKLMFEGPDDELEDTINAQPAILTLSVACLAALREKWTELGKAVQPIFVAGHSLGEYTALVAADVLDFSDALQLVRERGRLMKETSEHRPGGMAAVVGLDRTVLDEICEEAGQHG